MPQSPDPDRQPPPPPPPPPPRPPRMRSLTRKHRGGAWKVAYADFVTAMMALFIVLWMMNSSAQVKESVTGYFKDPKAWAKRVGAGPANSGEGLRVKKDDMKDLRDKIQAALEAMPEFKKLRDNVKMSATGEGLRIDLMESEQGMFFVQGSPNPTPAGEKLLHMLAGELSGMPNRM